MTLYVRLAQSALPIPPQPPTPPEPPPAPGNANCYDHTTGDVVEVNSMAKLAAIQDALQKSGIVDHSEAERFLIMWDALLPFIELPGQPAPVQSSATMLIEVVPTAEADKQVVAQIRQQSEALVRRYLPPA